MRVRYGNGDDTGVELARCDAAPHIAPWESHLCGLLELPGVAGTVDVKLLLDSGSGVTELSENMSHQLREPWPEVKLRRPYAGSIEAVGAEGWWQDLRLQMSPFHLTSAGERATGRVACASCYRL